MTKKGFKEIAHRHPVGVLRAFCSLMLLTLLGVCGYMGASHPAKMKTVSLPIARETISGKAISGASIEEVREELEKQRMQEIELLSSVIADSDAAQEAKESALNQKTQIAARMEQEAQIHAIMEAMGVKGALAVSGAQGVPLLLPTETAQDETLRNRLIYAAASQTGMEEKDIQIILIKK